MWLVGHLCIFFGEMAIQILCPLLNWIVYFLLLNFKSSLYILDVNLLSDKWFTDIFSHSVECLFTLLIMSYDVQIFKLWWSLIYLIFSCVACAFGVTSKKSLSNPMSWRFPYNLYFLLRVSYFLALTFMSLIHFELIVMHNIHIACEYPEITLLLPFDFGCLLFLFLG